MKPDLRNPMCSLGLLVLRLGMGGYMLTHGWPKVQMVMARDFDSFGDPLGLGAMPSLLLVTFAEFVCAILLMIGLATRPAALPIVATMAVAAFVAHGSDPWTMQEAASRFFEGTTQYPASKLPALMFLVPFLSLALTGAGGFSIDASLRRRRLKARAAA
jgi:putative oxidoreductase